MKRLTLVRHAQAESAVSEQSDFERTLTRRGQRDATEMARRLKQHKQQIDLILSSPALRALATAEIFLQVLKVPVNRLTADERLYTAGSQELLQTLRESDDRAKHVLIVAHNPGITEFADKLSHER